MGQPSCDWQETRRGTEHCCWLQPLLHDAERTARVQAHAELQQPQPQPCPQAAGCVRLVPVVWLPQVKMSSMTAADESVPFRVKVTTGGPCGLGKAEQTAGQQAAAFNRGHRPLLPIDCTQMQRRPRASMRTPAPSQPCPPCPPRVPLASRHARAAATGPPPAWPTAVRPGPAAGWGQRRSAKGTRLPAAWQRHGAKLCRLHQQWCYRCPWCCRKGCRQQRMRCLGCCLGSC